MGAASVVAEAAPAYTPTVVIAAVAAAAACVGGLIALYNARKAVLWKRAELANTLLRELATNDVLVFACRALEWNGVRLVVPDKLRPLLPDAAAFIDHDWDVMERAMAPPLSYAAMVAEPRIQIYRTLLDDFLSWLCVVGSAVDRKLFTAEDIEDVGYWLAKIRSREFLDDFIDAFGYRPRFDLLYRQFARQMARYP